MMAEKVIKPNLSVVGKNQKEIIEIKNFQVWINENHILDDIQLSIPKNEITCIIGPSGSGKSTLIRSINRINDDVTGLNTQGEIIFNGLSINEKDVDVAQLRTQIGMVFQKPCVFPKSIKENVLFGIQHLKKLSKLEKLQIAEENLKAVSLWKEVSHRLNDKAISLSIGQQQRLCIARTLAVKPEVILLDEPTSSLDPVSTRAIEDMMVKLKENYTIVFVTHNIQQAKRIADNLVFICDGKLIEQGPASIIFSCSSNPQTKAYLRDEYCDC
ncbi:phosphate ABC transporter ATP-binding protein [Gillisia sp. CAL575]|uniref:phosphate ABC transporter ATP-binding protein n=1 Tax=Gillisia sp. CAL575 TaxID=985255 RepID=UPI000A0612F4|nr:phosphate ABC transporter ATP-binding protein [Gillisia sp. CAL575]